MDGGWWMVLVDGAGVKEEVRSQTVIAKLL